MSVFARIVVGIDGTDWGFEALRQALVLAPKENAVVRAVTALDTAPAMHAGFHAAHFAEMLTNEAEEARAKAETIIAGREGCEARVVRGKPVDVLRRERDELQATLMALGGRRSSRFLGIMLGDTGTQLVHDAACSVLLAYPPEQSPWQPHKIVAGFDGSTDARAALATAEELARALGGAVEVVAATGGKPTERDPSWTDRVDTWDPADPVAALVERSRTVDLVVVGSRGAHGIRALGSVSERIAHQAHCTALVVHESQAAAVRNRRLTASSNREVATKTILIAIDSTESGRQAVEIGLELAADESASVTFVHVTPLVDLVEGMEDPNAPPNRVPTPEDDPVLRQALEQARDRGVSAHAELLLGYVPAQIARLAEDIDSDMIVVGSRSLGAVKRAVLGSTSRPLLSMTRRPVLIVQEPVVRDSRTV